MLARYEKLTGGMFTDQPAFLLQLTWMIENWLVNKTQEMIENQNKQIRKRTKSIIEPLLMELNELDEEIKLRKAIKPGVS